MIDEPILVQRVAIADFPTALINKEMQARLLPSPALLKPQLLPTLKRTSIRYLSTLSRPLKEISRIPSSFRSNPLSIFACFSTSTTSKMATTMSQTNASLYYADTDAPLCRLEVKKHFDSLSDKEAKYGTCGRGCQICLPGHFLTCTCEHGPFRALHFVGFLGSNKGASYHRLS